MTESTIDMDRAMQGIDCEVITWIKCSERMPSDDMPMIIVKLENSTEVFKYTRIRLKTYFASYRDIYARIAALSKTSWTPYTPEAWKELNRCLRE